VPNALGTTIDGTSMPVTYLRNLLGWSAKNDLPAVCAGGVCQVMDGVRPMPNPSNALAKDLRFMPDYELVARSALPREAAKRILRVGMLNAGLRSIVPATLAAGSGLLAYSGLKDQLSSPPPSQQPPRPNQ